MYVCMSQSVGSREKISTALTESTGFSLDIKLKVIPVPPRSAGATDTRAIRHLTVDSNFGSYDEKLMRKMQNAITAGEKFNGIVE